MENTMLPLLAANDDILTGQTVWLVLAAIAALIFLVFVFIFFNFLRLYVQSFLAGAKIGFVDMIRMKLLNVDYSMIVKQKIALVQAGVQVSTRCASASIRRSSTAPTPAKAGRRSTASARTASSSRPVPASPCGPSSTGSSAAPRRRRSSPASAK